MADNRMTPKEFEKKHGRILAMSLWGARWVGSALTKRNYIYFDHTKGDYAIEKR